jgi:hypothetical protein
MKDKYLKFGVAACLVIASFGIADAARRHHAAKAYAKEIAAACDLDKDYYATHSHWCDGAEKEHLVTIHHLPSVRLREAGRQTFPAVQSYEPTITVMHDHQGINDTSSTNTKYIALQTAEDVTRSPTVAYGLAGWFASAFDLGRKHPPIMMAAAPTRPAATKTVTTTTRTVTTVVAQQ